MLASSNKPVTEKRLEEILDKKLEEKLKPYVAQDYLEDRLELFEKGIDEKIRIALSEQTKEIVALISKHMTNILKPFSLTVADHEQRITTIEQTLHS